MWYFRVLVFILLLFSSSCGFQALYKNDDGKELNIKLASIAIQVNNNELGQQIKDHLSSLLNPYGLNIPTQYELNIELTNNSQPLAIQNNNDITLYEAKFTGKYILRDLINNKTILTDLINLGNSYAATPSEFATYIAEKDAYRSDINFLCAEIKNNLIVHLK